MPVCSKCGAELDEAAKFCMECGTPVSQNKKCIKCGAELPSKAKFCFSCGASQDADTPAAEKTEPNKKNIGETSTAKENVADENEAGNSKETFTDPRDGEVYKTCKIGNQIWMAENLRYRPPKGGSHAYDDDASNVKKYGRLYTWETAMEACPPGWHLPSIEDFNQLKNFIAKEYDVSDALRAEEWGDGIDAFGFSALPAGLRWWSYSDKEECCYYAYDDMGNRTHFWTSSKIIPDGVEYFGDGDDVFYFELYKNGTDIGYAYKKAKGCINCFYHERSVRCIKDAPIENGVQCDFCKKIFNADKNPIRTFEQEYIDGNPVQKKDIIKRMCYGCQNTIGHDFIKEQKELKQKYEKQ